MFRFASVLFVLALMFASASSWALGLGSLISQSALNQPFKGEIQLYDTRTDELDSVQARLAGPEEFNKVSVPRPFYLTQLKFEPQLNEADEPVILVSSREPIREPFMDFLVEVIWPEGRIVKEYTILLDPPRAGVEPPKVVIKGELILSEERTPPVAVTTPQPDSTAQTPAVDRQPEDGFPIRYGPVKAGAGLWRVASAMAPEGATVQQVAMALYRTNHDAFGGGNINNLITGANLVIPSAAELYALEPDEARSQFSAALAGRSVPRQPLAEQVALAETQEPVKKKPEAPAVTEPEVPEPAPAVAVAEPEPEAPEPAPASTPDEVVAATDDALTDDTATAPAPEDIEPDVAASAVTDTQAEPTNAAEETPVSQPAEQQASSVVPKSTDGEPQTESPVASAAVPEESEKGEKGEEQNFTVSDSGIDPPVDAQAADEASSQGETVEQDAPSGGATTPQNPEEAAMRKRIQELEAQLTKLGSLLDEAPPATPRAADGNSLLIWSLAGGGGVLLAAILGFIGFKMFTSGGKKSSDAPPPIATEARPAEEASHILEEQSAAALTFDEDELSLAEAPPVKAAAVASPTPPPEQQEVHQLPPQPAAVAERKAESDAAGSLPESKRETDAPATLPPLPASKAAAESPEPSSAMELDEVHLSLDNLPDPPEAGGVEPVQETPPPTENKPAERNASLDRVEIAPGDPDLEVSLPLGDLEQQLGDGSFGESAFIGLDSTIQQARLDSLPGEQDFDSIMKPSSDAPIDMEMDLDLAKPEPEPAPEPPPSEPLSPLERATEAARASRGVDPFEELIEAELTEEARITQEDQSASNTDDNADELPDLDLSLNTLQNDQQAPPIAEPVSDQAEGSNAPGNDLAADIEKFLAGDGAGSDRDSTETEASGELQNLDLEMSSEAGFHTTILPSSVPPGQMPSSSIPELDLELEDLDALVTDSHDQVPLSPTPSPSPTPPAASEPDDLPPLQEPQATSAPASGSESMADPTQVLMSEPPAEPGGGNQDIGLGDENDEPAPLYGDESLMAPDSGASDVLSSQWRMDSGMWDEVATKMDLAFAYIEMEDAEAARAILEEVVREGNDEQRADAEELLKKLDA